jgi:hypothetical protein
MKKIILQTKDRAELVKKYGKKNVSVALSFRSNSIMAREIRHIALNDYNGQMINLNF